jgi:hypothetical protein
VHRRLSLFAPVLLALIACDSSTPAVEANPAEPVAKAPATKTPTEAAAEPAVEPTVEPTLKPPTPEVAPGETLVAITPDTVLSFQADAPSTGWKADPEYPNEFKQGDAGGPNLMFTSHTFTSAGTPYTLAVWMLDADTQHAHAALFRGPTGAHQLVWRKPSFAEHLEAPDEMLLPSVVSTGPERLAILFAPYSVGCGGEGCEADEPHDSQLLDVTPDGLTVIWSHAGGCVPEAERHPIAPDQCLVGFEAGESTDVHDLVLTMISERKEQTERFVFRDGAYQAN